MVKAYWFTLAVFILCTACAEEGEHGAHTSASFLFVGNSLTYVGNLPAVIEALGKSQNVDIHADFLGDGGMTLSEHHAGGIVQQLVARQDYDFVILQERGGDLICTFGPDSCEKSRSAHGQLAEVAREAGAVPILMGTYQFREAASDAISNAEQQLSLQLGIPHLEVSKRLRSARSVLPEFEWLADDGAHPGKSLQLLVAAALYRQTIGEIEQSVLTDFAICASALEACSLPAAPIGSGVRETAQEEITVYKKPHILQVLSLQ